MNMIEAAKVCLAKCFTIQGRARRSEFWWFYLDSIIACLALGILGVILALIPILGWILDIVIMLVEIALIIPFVTSSVRRLHDVGKSGWWMLLWLACCIGPFVLIYFHIKDSDPGENQFGPNPKDVDEEEAAESDESMAETAGEPAVMDEPEQTDATAVAAPVMEAEATELAKPVQEVAPVMDQQNPASNKKTLKIVLAAVIAVVALIVLAILGVAGYFYYQHAHRFEKPVYETFSEKELASIYEDEDTYTFESVYLTARDKCADFTAEDSLHYKELTYKRLWEYMDYLRDSTQTINDRAVQDFVDQYITPYETYLNADVEKWNEYIEKHDVKRYLNIDVNECYHNQSWYEETPAFYFTVNYVSDEVVSCNARVSIVNKRTNSEDTGLTPADISLPNIKSHTDSENTYYYQRDLGKIWNTHRLNLEFTSVRLQDGSVLTSKDMKQVPKPIVEYLNSKEDLYDFALTNLKANTIREMYNPQMPDLSLYVSESVQNALQLKDALSYEFVNRQNYEYEY